MSRKKVVTVFNKNQKPSKNRRTSLNVNLSYTSRASSSGEDEANAFSEICEEDDASIVEKSVHLPAKRSLSTKRSVSGKLGAVSNIDSDLARIKPSVVRIVRISTGTPVTAQRHGDRIGERDAAEILEPSENTRRSSALQNVRFPLEGEIFSPEAHTIVMETSMDITDVQGAAILGFEPAASDRAALDQSDNSFGVIRDTDSLRFEDAPRIPHVVIPESDRDSLDTVRTSLNVNTSLDSRFSSMPNESLYDPKSSRLGDVDKDVQVHERNRSEGILSYPNSESSDANSMANTVIITKAVIEHDDSPSDRNEQRLFEDESTIDLDSEIESRFSPNTSLTKIKNKTSSACQLTLDTNISQHHQDGATASREQPVSRPAPTPSGLDSTNNSCSSSASLHLRLSNEENENAVRIIPEILPSQPTMKKKKKLYRPRMSGLIELSPVSVQISDKPRAIVKKRKNWGKPVRGIFNDPKVVARRMSTPVESLSECDLDEIDASPKKQKRLKRVKAKKIVIKKMADISLRNRINGNNNANESCEEISLALRRTSLDDFAPRKNLATRRNRKSRPKMIIVATGLPIEEKLQVKRAVTALGSAKLEKIVTSHTTHVITKGTRTVNLLRGIVRGCWLVGFEWISRSRDHGEWLNPQQYEITNIFPKAVQDNRKEKQLFGAAYVSELFLTCGAIHVEEETSTPPEVLRELVRTAGGRVASSPVEAKIIIGRGGLKEVWILDSITNGELQPMERYCKKKNPN